MLNFAITKCSQSKMKIIKHPYFLLFLIVCAALCIRLMNLKDNILFTYDQARDAQRVYTMVYQGKFKIVGPETDIQGIFNGPLLYYALAPIYYFSNFNPNAAALLFICINVGTILLIFWAAKILFNKNSIALIASLLWAFSFEQGFFARYISNASAMSCVTTVFFIGLALFFLNKKQWGLPLSAIGLALSIHSNFFYIYLFLFYPLFFILFKKKPHIKTSLMTLISLAVLLSPWILTELKWKFIGTRSLIAYFVHQGSAVVNSHSSSFIVSMFIRYYNRISQGIYFSFIPNKLIGFFIICGILLYLIMKKRSASTLFLAFWLLNTLPLFAFKSGVHSVEVINGSVFVPLTLFFAFGIVELSRIKIQKIPMLSLLCLIGVLFYGIYCYEKNDFIPSSIQTGTPQLLKDEKKVIDYTYMNSGKNEFSICSISEPLFMNTTWSFLYATYGKQKYGYLPYWTGQTQILNDSFIPYAHKKYATKFIIQEPMQGIPDYAPKSTIYIEDKQNEFIKTEKFGFYIVQQRHFTKVNNGNYLQLYTEKQREQNESLMNLEPRFSCDITYE